MTSDMTTKNDMNYVFCAITVLPGKSKCPSLEQISKLQPDLTLHIPPCCLTYNQLEFKHWQKVRPHVCKLPDV